MGQPHLEELGKILARAVLEREPTKEILSKAGVDLADVDLDGPSRRRWASGLEVAQRTRRLDALFDVVLGAPDISAYRGQISATRDLLARKASASGPSAERPPTKLRRPRTGGLQIVALLTAALLVVALVAGRRSDTAARLERASIFAWAPVVIRLPPSSVERVQPSAVPVRAPVPLVRAKASAAPHASPAPRASALEPPPVPYRVDPPPDNTARPLPGSTVRSPGDSNDWSSPLLTE